MKNLIRVLLMIWSIATSAQLLSGQLRIGVTPASTSVTLTVVITGTGTGSISSSDGLISACTSAGGPNCTATENSGTSVTLTATPTGGSSFSWSSCTDGASGCAGSNPLIFSITSNATINAVFNSSGGNAIPASPYFVLDLNSSAQYPTTIAHGGDRFWDTPKGTRTFIEACSNGTNVCAAGATVFDFTTFDTILLNAKNAGVSTTQLALARTPNFASSDPNAVDGPNCNYFVSGSTLQNQLAGQCYPPSDLNNDGTGTNQYWREWVAKVSAHANALDGNAGFLTTHSHINTWEVWNEPSVAKFYRGTLAQLIRMQEDTVAIINGYGNWTYTLTSVNGAGVYQGTFSGGTKATCDSNACVGQHVTITGFTNSGNNLTNAIVTASTTTSLTFSATTTVETHAGSAVIVNQFTGETGAQIRATVTSITLSGPTDTNAMVIMPSYFGTGVGLTQLGQFLYCSGAANCGGVGGHIRTAGINFHAKPGNNAPTLPEVVLDGWIAAITAKLSGAELTKPYDNTEGGYSATNFADCVPAQTSPPYCNYSDPDMQASFISRVNIYGYWKGIANHVWYDYSPANGGGLGSSAANIAYGVTFGWMVGDTNLTCSATAGVYTCPVTLPNSVSAQFMWDTNQDCAGGVCTTSNQTVPNGMLSYLLLTDSTQTKQTISSHIVPVGVKPVLIQAQ